ncbi:MAG: mechanosensitive ion channel [Xenococcaceae cyanobacterium]
MTQIIDTIMQRLSPLILAQERVTPETQPVASDALSWVDKILSEIGLNLGSSVLELLKAMLILVVGWIIAVIAKKVTHRLLKQTDVDNKIASWITGEQEGELPLIEKWISEVVYWLIILFALVAFLNALELQAVSDPLNSLLEQVTGFLPQIAGAAILLGFAWLLATLTKLLVTRGLEALRLDERLGQQVGETSEENQFVLSETIGNALYWFIFLIFLTPILETLGLEGTLAPVQGLLDDILAIVPNVLAAVLIGAVGWLIAQVVRRVVINLLAATGVDLIGAKFGLSTTAGRQSLSQILGAIVYVLILIPVVITALDALKIQAISEPATAMLNQVLNILPNIFAAVVILVLAYVAGRYISELLTNILTGIGFNNIFQWLGLSFPRSTPTTEPETKQPEETGQESVIQTTEAVPTRTPSELAGIFVLIAIMLVATLTAVDILQIEALKTVVGVILRIAGQVLIGLIVFAIGLYLANLAFNLISSTHTRQSKMLGQTARIAIIILVSAMALQQMGIAPNIVNLAFGLLVGGIAVAIALAFGLGGREVAAEQLREWLDSFKQD